MFLNIQLDWRNKRFSLRFLLTGCMLGFVGHNLEKQRIERQEHGQ